MSFAIVARCARSGRLGLAVASKRMAAGNLCTGAARSSIGATITLGVPRPRNNTLAIELLAQGFGPQQVLQQLRSNDPDCEQRVVALIDRTGRAAASAGASVRAPVPVTADGCVTLGDGFASAQVLKALADSFDGGSDANLDARLLMALEAGRDAGGGQALRSAAIVVFGVQDYSDVDLRVDLHDEPIGELRRTYDEYQPFAAYYVERAKNPRQAITQREFADMLARQAKEAS